RLIENDELGPHGQPLAQHDLLLIATGQFGRIAQHIGRLDTELVALIEGTRNLEVLRHQAVTRDRAKVGERDGFADRTFEHEASESENSGHEIISGVDCLAWAAGAKRFSGKANFAIQHSAYAENCLGQFGSSRADETGNAEDLAASNFETCPRQWFVGDLDVL